MLRRLATTSGVSNDNADAYERAADASRDQVDKFGELFDAAYAEARATLAENSSAATTATGPVLAAIEQLIVLVISNPEIETAIVSLILQVLGVAK
jgi:hypothetical protein